MFYIRFSKSETCLGCSQKKIIILSPFSISIASDSLYYTAFEKPCRVRTRTLDKDACNNAVVAASFIEPLLVIAVTLCKRLVL